MHKIKARRHGFTLIEILVVITIISVLQVSVFFPTPMRKKQLVTQSEEQICIHFALHSNRITPQMAHILSHRIGERHQITDRTPPTIFQDLHQTTLTNFQMTRVPAPRIYLVTTVR